MRIPSEPRTAGPWAGIRCRQGKPARRERGRAASSLPQADMSLSCERSSESVRGRRYCLAPVAEWGCHVLNLNDQTTRRGGTGCGGLHCRRLRPGTLQPDGIRRGVDRRLGRGLAGLAGRVLPTTRVGALALPAGACLAGIAILGALSVTWAADQGRAFEEAARAAFYLGLFSLAACTAGRAGRAEWLIGLVVGLGIVSVVSLFAYLQPGVLDSGGSDLPGAAGRLAYPIGYWNATAALLVAASTLLAHAGVRSPTRALRTAAIAAIPLAVLALWLTGSRGGAAAHRDRLDRPSRSLSRPASAARRDADRVGRRGGAGRGRDAAGLAHQQRGGQRKEGRRGPHVERLRRHHRIDRGGRLAPRPLAALGANVAPILAGGRLHRIRGGGCRDHRGRPGHAASRLREGPAHPARGCRWGRPS